MRRALRPRCIAASHMPACACATRFIDGPSSSHELLQPLCQPHLPLPDASRFFCATISKLQPTVTDGERPASEHAAFLSITLHGAGQFEARKVFTAF